MFVRNIHDGASTNSDNEIEYSVHQYLKLKVINLVTLKSSQFLFTIYIDMNVEEDSPNY